MTYCNGFDPKRHAAVAFLGADCPVCLLLNASGFTSAATPIEGLKLALSLEREPVKRTRPTRDEYFLELLDLVARRSTCARRAVGAIITDTDGHVLSTGYNGVPRLARHCIDVPCAGATDPSGDTSRCAAVHAEANALLQCRDLRSAFTLYVSCEPCYQCAKLIANTLIVQIVCREEYADERGRELFATSGIKMVVARRV